MLRGIDIYSGDGWPLSAHGKKCFAESDFVIVKATQGTDYKNPYFAHQMRGAEKAGKLLGCYHYAEERTGFHHYYDH